MLLTNPEPATKNGVLLLSEHNPAFEATYVAVREAENRIVTDGLLSGLPHTPKNHPHHREWMMRNKSAERTLKLVSWNGPILDLGCGNGWFTNMIAEKAEQPVIGLDVNLPELEQAARVFERDNLTFAYGNIFDDIFPAGSFGVITINSCVQYFEDAPALIARLLELLREDGRIFIIDSPFYTPEQVAQATTRSEAYYKKLGFPEMSANYFHHPKSVLEGVDAALVYDPNSIRNRAKRLSGQIDSPFPMVRIAK